MQPQSKKHHNNKTRKLKGGIHIVKYFTPSTAFKHFIMNSTFSVFSTRETTSVILTAKLNDGIVTPYKTVRLNEFNTPVRTILIKLCSCKINNEVYIQKDVYHKSFTNKMSYFEPVCPSIIYSSPAKLKQPFTQQLHTLLINLLENKSQASVINRIFEQDIYLIAMELMENYQPLSSFQGTPNFEKYRFMALYELHRLHQFGYMHNDFHFENVLIHPTYNYFSKKSGRAILFDFGYSIRVKPETTHLEMLQYEVSGINNNIFNVFDYFHTQRQAYQTECVASLEIKLNVKLNKVVNILLFYRGAGMDDIQNNQIQQHKPDYRENEWANLTFETFQQIIAKEFEENFEKNDPEGFKKYNDSINSVLEEQKTDTKYFEKLLRAQFNGLIIQR